MNANPPSEAPPSLAPKRPSAGRTTLAQIMGGTDTNLHGNIHGGVIMRIVDNAGGATAARHSGGRAVTASMDEMAFLIPVRVGDLVTAVAQVNWAGRTSMEVGVRVTTERWDQAGQPPVHVASAYLVYVAIDEAGHPRPVPPLVPETAVERHRLSEAEIRRESRLARRAAIMALRAERGEAIRRA
ncbi:MAG: acyl-CoA thioesterase [Frankiaceae bacterium]